MDLFKKENDNKLEEIDITPPVSIYNVFSSFDYDITTAISEFLDNSTQSYKDNKNEILESVPNFVPKIYIIYYSNHKILQIIDNCYGIKTDKIDRVLKINTDSNKLLNSRNEFGMGLKTASFWFARNLKILSKCMKENFAFSLFLSLDELKNKVSPKKEDSRLLKDKIGFKFGTVIELSELNKTAIPTDKKLIKLAKILSSKYTFDIQEENFNIFIIKVKTDEANNYHYQCVDKDEFKDIDNFSQATKLTFLKERFHIDEQTNEEIKINIDDSFNFDDKEYYITGEIGILEKGSRDNAGLILFRQQRSILGEESGKRYKPRKIFKDGASFEYQRIYGILNLDDFPITQQKNAFKWDNGLEDALIDFLYEKIVNGNFNLIKKARTVKYKKNKDFNTEKIIDAKTAKEIEENINLDNVKVDYVEDKEKKSIKFTFTEKNGTKTVLNLYINNEIKDWIEISEGNKNNNEYNVSLNINFDFFDPFNNDEEFIKHQMITFCIYFAYSEIRHHYICKESSHQRDIINSILKGEIKNV